jgi:hypothetical protein
LTKVFRGNLIREAAERHQAMTISISKLFLYPIKSCRGIPVSSAEITPLGFKYDRNYMLVEVKPPKADDNDGLKPETWVPMTLRQHPRVSVLTIKLCLTKSQMGLINTSIENGEIIVTAETSSERITLPLSPRLSELFTKLSVAPSIFPHSNDSYYGPLRNKCPSTNSSRSI